MRHSAASVLLLALLAAGCSSLPSNGRVRSEVVSALTVPSVKDLYEIQDFKVLSGYQKDPGTYVAKVHYDFVLKKGITGLPKELEVDPKLVRTSLVLGKALARAVLSGTSIQIGTHLPVDDEVTLVKQDGNWVFEAITLKAGS